MSRRKEFFPEVTDQQWNDWHWQVKNRIETVDELKKYIKLTAEEEEGIRESLKTLRMAITPYYLTLIDPENPHCPIRKQAIPTVEELKRSPADLEDPLHEDSDSPVPGLTHRYPDRVLFLITDMCSMYCRHCTRRRFAGQHDCATPEKQIEDCIRERLSVELRKYHKALQQALDLMGWLDVVIAKAMQARDWGLTRPAITQDTASFRGLFNPELRISLEAAGKRFQPVNIRLTTGPTVITGANMSGKTVLLHSVELAQYMLQFGFYIAAERAEMALVDEVHCSVGDGQDQLSGLSSFAAEMMRMDELAKSVRAGRRVLALIDEPARTTNPVEGRAIVNGVLEFLADYEVPSLVTTHYNGIAAPCCKLKVKGFSETNAEEKITLKNINDFIDYSLEEVTTDEVPHEAIRIARILGIDPEILRRIERNEELKNNQ